MTQASPSAPRAASRISTTEHGIEVESVPCPLCGEQDDHPVIVESPDHETRLGQFRVVECRACQMRYTNPRPTEQSIGRFYAEGYQPYQKPVDSNRMWTRFRHRWERAALVRRHGYEPIVSSQLVQRFSALLGEALFSRTRQRMEWFDYVPNGRLLDFGCGAGGFLRRMQKLGWHVEGLDFSADVAAQVRREFNIPVHVGSLPHPELIPESYDVITMWNSLEHVHDPRRVVEAAWQLLRPGGRLVVGVPNIESWTFRQSAAEWHALDVPRHLNHFAPRTLTQLLEQAGFESGDVQHVPYVGWIRRTAQRCRDTASGTRPLVACTWKPWAMRVAEWTARTNQADFIRAEFEKPRKAA